MSSATWKFTAAAALLLALTLTAAMRVAPVSPVQAQQRSDEEEDKSGRKLEGTWRVQVTLRNCQTGAELRPPTPALLTFTKGGTLTETTTVFPAAMRGPGHGFWRHTGGQTYTAVTEAFLFNPAAPPTSAWIGTQRLTQTIQLGENRDELYSTASTAFFGPDGNPIPGFPPSGCATAVARRME